MTAKDIIPDKILIVDDNLKNLQILGLLLRDNGYSVSMAQSGSEAINVLH
jgi:CheY-like chemotaxis protein